MRNFIIFQIYISKRNLKVPILNIKIIFKYNFIQKLFDLRHKFYRIVQAIHSKCDIRILNIYDQ